MNWIKFGILIIGFIYAGLLPYTIRKAIQHVDIDLSRQTLSFLSDKKTYGPKYGNGYKQLLFVTAILTYAFFWLLSINYDLGTHEKFMRQVDICSASLTLLAFVPFNMCPYSLQNLIPSLKRIIHNLLALIVFLSLSALIIIFQFAVFHNLHFLGITGLVIIGVVTLNTLISLIKTGLNGTTELLFINGTSIWNIFVTFVTVLS
jgi:hypothetical protein